MKRLEDKPFALLGINSDSDKQSLKKVIQKEGITWRSWWDRSPGGPIAKKWKVHSWPTIYVLDHKGVIRYKDVREKAMDGAVDILLKELEQEPQTEKQPQN